jgi:hypothetical protein
MRVLKVIAARSIWLFPITDLNPRGKAVDIDLIEWLKKTYQFQKFPSSAFDFDKDTKTLSFLGGRFKTVHDGKEEYIAIGLSIYNDGLVVNTESSTEEGDRFLDQTLRAVAKEFDLIYPENVRRKFYYNEMDIRLDRPIKLLNPKLEQLAKLISELRKGPTVTFEFSGVSFLSEPAAQSTTLGVVIERKVGTEWSENRYWTRAPLETASHIKLLENLEAILA